MTTVRSLTPPAPVVQKILGWPVTTIEWVRKALHDDRYGYRSADDTDLLFAIKILDSVLSSGSEG